MANIEAKLDKMGLVLPQPLQVPPHSKMPFSWVRVRGRRAFISGHCLVHQFVRVGRLSMMQGGAAISKDLPPFCVARGDNGICGLNTVGLRRAGLTAEERSALRRAYHRIFRSGARLKTSLEAVREEFADQPAVMELAEFIAASRRGIGADSGRRSGRDDEE